MTDERKDDFVDGDPAEQYYGEGDAGRGAVQTTGERVGKFGGGAPPINASQARRLAIQRAARTGAVARTIAEMPSRDAAGRAKARAFVKRARKSDRRRAIEKATRKRMQGRR